MANYTVINVKKKPSKLNSQILDNQKEFVSESFGYSAELFSSLEKGLFLFSGVGTSSDVRYRVLYADGDACIHRCRQHYAAPGVAPTPLTFFFS